MIYRWMSAAVMCATLLFAVLLWSCGASQAYAQETQRADEAHKPQQTKGSASRNLDACSLLSGKEISAVLGEPLVELKPSVQSAGSLKMSHCLFLTRNFAKSASLDVATPAAGESSARSLRAFWRNQFHSPPKHEEDKRHSSRKIPARASFSSSRDAQRADSPANESENEEEAESGKPRSMPGVGEEAYWVGTPLTGALYVLQGNLFLRISVGGLPKESVRIAKSKLIANAVLARLPR
jgi:hypothetical protein